MKLGLFGINNGPLAEPDAMAIVARAAETAGFESLWTGEHVVLPDPQVPPSPVPPGYPMMDPATALGFLASETDSVGLATGIIIVPQRNPAVLAKELATVDVLSKGRLIFGIGVGYLKPEFDALGVSFDKKGARTDEYVEAIQALWTQEKPSYQGEFVSFEGVNAFPRPVQQPHPPIVVGGMSEAAQRRALARGNGWYGFALDLEATRQALASLETLRAHTDRPEALGRLEISITPPAGSLSRDELRAFRDAGVDRLVAMPKPFGREEGPEAYVSWLTALGDASAGL